MSTARCVFLGLLVWVFALFLFFVPMGGMGMFSHSQPADGSKPAIAGRDGPDPFAGKPLSEVSRIDPHRSKPEFRQWARPGQARNPVGPIVPRGTRPRPMTNLSPY